jgi:uncharacterized protein HemY
MNWMGLQFRGVISYARGDAATANQYLREAARVGHDASEPVLEGSSLSCFADNLIELGDCAGALALLDGAYEMVRHDPWSAGTALQFMGKAALAAGDAERARAALEAALSLAHLHDDPHSSTLGPREFGRSRAGMSPTAPGAGSVCGAA